MRVLKFRGWSKQKKKMFPVSDINFGYDGAARTVTFEEAAMGLRYDGLVDGESGVLMQFTGQKDMNGVEIYEGDIIRMPGPYETVAVPVAWGPVQSLNMWDAGETWLLCFPGGHVVSLFSHCDHRSNYRLTVVGNIYEHPELLQKESTTE